MAELSKARITITRSFGLCPACEKDIEAETAVSFDGDQVDRLGGSNTVNLNGHVVGIRLEHNCIPSPTRGRGRGRPPGAKNKSKVTTEPAPEAVEPIAKSDAEAHRDRLREHEAMMQTNG